jgi:hypothetical protein
MRHPTPTLIELSHQHDPSEEPLLPRYALRVIVVLVSRLTNPCIKTLAELTAGMVPSDPNPSLHVSVDYFVFMTWR